MIHGAVREAVDIKSEKIKSAYDRKAREVDFTVGQKVRFYNPRRERAKLQNCKLVKRGFMK